MAVDRNSTCNVVSWPLKTKLKLGLGIPCIKHGNVKALTSLEARSKLLCRLINAGLVELSTDPERHAMSLTDRRERRHKHRQLCSCITVCRHATRQLRKEMEGVVETATTWWNATREYGIRPMEVKGNGKSKANIRSRLTE